MTWKKKLPGCFGSGDRRFAGHSTELKQAHELLGDLIEQGADWASVEAEIRAHLSSLPKSHVDDQVNKARSLYDDWLR